MPSSAVCIDTLPNEIVQSVLTLFSTKDLLTLLPISHRFHSLITRILHLRLITVASLPSNDLIFECYHPSAKISTPYLSCRYLSTKTEGDELVPGSEALAISDLKRLYSSFRPVVAEENMRRRRRVDLLTDSAEDSYDETAKEEVYLDEGELFSQLCAVTNVVKMAQKPGLFVSHVNMSDGVIRVFRDWLADMASGTKGTEKSLVDDDSILWVDTARSIGVRFKVTYGASERMPVMSGPDDHPPISYSLQYEELLVRTTKLLMAVEKSAIREVSHSGRATTYDTMKIPPFKIFARNARMTWLPQESSVFDEVLASSA